MSVLVLMGVSGAGKSTVGRLLATRLGWSFADADDHHPPANREKMARGVPLDASDREAWLAGLAERIRGWLDAGEPVVLACSALTRASRRTLRVDPSHVRFVHLVGPPGLIRERLLGRTDHFMPPDLLESQLDALEAPGPDEALRVPVDQPPEAIAEHIARWVEREPGS